jgi:hypothetical protein
VFNNSQLLEPGWDWVRAILPPALYTFLDLSGVTFTFLLRKIKIIEHSQFKKITDGNDFKIFSTLNPVVRMYIVENRYIKSDFNKN